MSYRPLEFVMCPSPSYLGVSADVMDSDSQSFPFPYPAPGPYAVVVLAACLNVYQRARIPAARRQSQFPILRIVISVKPFPGIPEEPQSCFGPGSVISPVAMRYDYMLVYVTPWSRPILFR
ncbi:hypothetical protein BOTBODRAFT_223277 [Botryobasidium botryosum FD-172 SS1]|uniref:Uncharacterized protein n=1 Tax=Botryobasidium botryosum (strain FD-172 SS1) TaxID=930990 RepID=A0A067MN94_BOTB1|nr:hypothetical protein BOTBODRAFT_223277 [Botryobasidium botryosum FD-172 SS1]